LLERRPTWGGGRQNFIMLTLEALTDVQTQELVGNLMTELPPTIRKHVAERSGGNPFFAIELIQVLAEQSATGKDVAELDILPDTVHAAVLAQLDHLSPQEHRIVQTASVVGHTFSSKILHAVLSDLQPDEIEDALDALIISNLIVLAEEGNYTFRHTLIREVAYGTLSRAERIRLHGTIISSLEPFSVEHADEYMELLAYHYREAIQLAGQSAVPIELPPELTHALDSWRRRDRGHWLDLNFS
jgi:predicted ATPase